MICTLQQPDNVAPILALDYHPSRQEIICNSSEHDISIYSLLNPQPQQEDPSSDTAMECQIRPCELRAPTICYGVGE